ncbi:hypothetical protein GGS26DRAFT_95869 [Hypomontagnella submonticulosa]|nr:hypothetical protein GGS26DRAFT_95869 [Hypomontagnella submonticulosa]
MRFLTVAILFLSRALFAIAAGGYSQECQNITAVAVGSHTNLRAYCKDPSGALQCSILDLNYCYGYTGRRIVPRILGWLSWYCSSRYCRLEGTTLECWCYKNPFYTYKELIQATIDTDALVFNDNGFLNCIAHSTSVAADCAKVSDTPEPDRETELEAYLTLLVVKRLFLYVWN